MPRGLGRRAFLATAGAAGLTLWFAVPGRPGAPMAAASAFEPNAMLTITPDGVITVHVIRAEMGQGIGTALAQIAAEELEADWKDIRLSYPVNDPKYGRMHTVGSLSIKALFDPLSRAALKERGSVTNGAFDQKNFDDYPILRMDEVPELDIHVVESTEAPTGTGEQAVTVVAPALANAIFAATGARVRSLPFLPERVLKALKDKA